jgi:hypothetical protein
MIWIIFRFGSAAELGKAPTETEKRLAGRKPTGRCLGGYDLACSQLKIFATEAKKLM